MPCASQVGSGPAGAQDGPLRPHGLRRHRGGASLQGEGGTEGRAEGGGGGGEEGGDQPHHPGKQRLHQHTQQPQPQRIDTPRLRINTTGYGPPSRPSLPRRFRPSSPSRFPTACCGGDPIRWRPLHIVRAYYIYPNLFYLSTCRLDK